MNRDDVIRMAREAGFSQPWTAPTSTQERLERFANFVAAAEREACANEVRAFFAVMRFDRRHLGLGDVRVTVGDVDDLADSICKNQLEIESVKDSLTVEEAVAAEREACAKVCVDLVLAFAGRADLTALQCAEAIRARGDK